ncbi:uncharacterized protein [Taeniopygia guttata]|uniref:uncharacterized protein isoform X1 n=1 Tax=Taeniopygia guttata TaxID=59729 RepID=UPI003BB981D8
MNEPRSPLLRARSYKSPARCGQRSTATGTGPAGSRGARRRHRPPHGGRPPRLPAAAQAHLCGQFSQVLWLHPKNSPGSAREAGASPRAGFPRQTPRSRFPPPTAPGASRTSLRCSLGHLLRTKVAFIRFLFIYFRSHLEGKQQVLQHPSWGHPSLLEPPEGAACSLTAPGASSPSFPLARSRRCLPVPGGCGAAVRAAGASPAPGKHRELGDNPTAGHRRSPRPATAAAPKNPSCGVPDVETKGCRHPALPEPPRVTAERVWAERGTATSSCQHHQRAGENGMELGAAQPCCSALTHGTPG